MSIRTISKFAALALLAILSISMLPSFAFESTVKPNVRTVVIAQIHIQAWGLDWTSFKGELMELKRIGVDAIKTDIAWDVIEPSPGIFSWTYYQKYFEVVTEAGLLWIPQIAVHYVPSWVWAYYPDAKFVNEFNGTSDMYMSYWHPQARHLIQRVYSEFFAAFSDYNETIYGVYVSAGGWSELAYPIFPSRAYWAYDVNAKADFREMSVTKYGTIENANQHWGTAYSNWTMVNAPLPNTPYTNMWNDFLSWYGSTLVEFEDWILNRTRAYYDGWVGIHIPLDSTPEFDIKLGHLDYDAIFSTVTKYEAIASDTGVEFYDTAMEFSMIAKKYNLTCWAENAAIGANLQTILDNLRYGDYDVYCYYWMTDLFDNQTNPTTRFNYFKNFIRQWDPAPVADFEYQPTELITGSTIIFNASGSLGINGVIVKYEWNFDDGNITTVTAPIITHTYSQTGDYTVVLNVTDSLGLWNIFFRHLIVYEHDVSVTAVQPYRIIVDNASSTSINITVANQGDYFETFNVTLYANETIIQTQQTSMMSWSSKTLPFNWNTTDVRIGNYTLRAVVSSVENEIILGNNESVDGLIRISVKGDIDGSGKVDMKDVSYVARRFMCLPGDSLWDSNADINEDRKIDMKDVSTIAKEFGR